MFWRSPPAQNKFVCSSNRDVHSRTRTRPWSDYRLAPKRKTQVPGCEDQLHLIWAKARAIGELGQSAALEMSRFFRELALRSLTNQSDTANVSARKPPIADWASRTWSARCPRCAAEPPYCDCLGPP